LKLIWSIDGKDVENTYAPSWGLLGGDKTYPNTMCILYLLPFIKLVVKKLTIER